MPRHPLAGAILAAGWLCALSCSLVVDTSDVDEGCGPNHKLCADKCVAQSDAAYGCTRAGCDPCRLTNAIPGCAGETCVVKACLLGFGCPDEKTGCLNNILVEPAHCGDCFTPCQPGDTCSNGTCVAGHAGSGD